MNHLVVVVMNLFLLMADVSNHFIHEVICTRTCKGWDLQSSSTFAKDHTSKLPGHHGGVAFFMSLDAEVVRK